MTFSVRLQFLYWNVRTMRKNKTRFGRISSENAKKLTLRISLFLEDTLKQKKNLHFVSEYLSDACMHVGMFVDSERNKKIIVSQLKRRRRCISIILDWFFFCELVCINGYSIHLNCTCHRMVRFYYV